MSDRAAGLLLISGSLVFLLGAALGVPRVFTEPDPAMRLRLIERRLGSWRGAQPLYGLGPIVCGIGARMPRWPFRIYVLFTVAGLILLGAGLIAGSFPAWLGWTTLFAAGAFLVLYMAAGDIPPFVFYLLLLVVGLAVL